MKQQSYKALLLSFVLFIAFSPLYLLAQSNFPQPPALEARIQALESRFHSHADAGIAAFLFGAFCALWAQNTGRSAWLWFLLGALFSVITVLVLLYKNSQD